MGALTPLLQSANADPAWTTETVPYRTVLLDKTTDPVEKPSAVTIVSAHSGIAGPADMKGKKWGYNPGSNDYAMFLFSLRKAGLSAKDVDAITINNTDGVQAIIAGDLDLWSGAGFNAIPALQRGAKVLWRGPDVGFESRIAHAARSDVLADPVRSAAAGAFIVGLAKFYLYQQAHPDEFIQVAVDVNKYTYDQAKLRSTYLSAPVPITPDVLKEQKQLADVLFDSGTLKRRIDVDLVYDDRYTKLITPLL
jgi:sulfonate transport system substrate-binding protein